MEIPQEIQSSAQDNDTKLNQRAKYSVDMLILPIKRENPCGQSLRHDPLYDKIREARREDDDTVSRGVWQFELKRADWYEVETLGGDALISQTKDLQVAGWVGESWIMLGGLPGVSRSLNLISRLCEQYWPNLYPEIESEEMEYRSQFFDWYDQNLTQRLVSLPVAEEEYVDYPFTLADWMSALHFEVAIKRSNDPGKLIQKSESKGQPVLKRLQGILRQVPRSVLQDKIKSLQSLSQDFQTFMTLLNSLMPNSTVAFNQFKPALTEMIRIYETEINQRPVPINSSTSESLSQEAEPYPIPIFEEQENDTASIANTSSSQGLSPAKAYAQIAEIADYFQQTDPHNPASQILRRVVSWQNKSFMDILTEMGSSPEELVAFMKFMGVTGPK
jgi:type VI secretion system protein ImpA